jgi:hypothetical protein
MEFKWESYWYGLGLLDLSTNQAIVLAVLIVITTQLILGSLPSGNLT